MLDEINGSLEIFKTAIFNVLKSIYQKIGNRLIAITKVIKETNYFLKAISGPVLFVLNEFCFRSVTTGMRITLQSFRQLK